MPSKANRSYPLFWTKLLYVHLDVRQFWVDEGCVCVIHRLGQHSVLTMKRNGRRGFTTGPCGAAGVVTIWSICKLCEHCDDRGQSHTPQMVVIKRFVRIKFCEFVLLARLSLCLTILSNPANPFVNNKVPGKKTRFIPQTPSVDTLSHLSHFQPQAPLISPDSWPATDSPYWRSSSLSCTRLTSVRVNPSSRP